MEASNNYLASSLNTSRIFNNRLLKEMTNIFNFFVCSTLFFLPLYEVPKNISVVFVIIIGSWILYSSTRVINLDRASRTFVGLALLSVLLLCMSGIFGPVPIFALKNSFDWLKIVGFGVSIALVAARHPLPISRYFMFLILGVGVAIVEGILRGSQTFPALRSVGHINQTAQYLALAASAAIAVFISQSASNRSMFAVGSLLLVIGSFVLLAQARTSVYAFFITGVFVVALLLLAKSTRKSAYFLACVMAVTLLVNHQSTEKIYRKQHYHLQAGSADVTRPSLLRTALTVAAEAPWLGHGADTYPIVVNPSSVQLIVEKSGATFHMQEYAFSNHAHSLIGTWLVERGVVSLILVYAGLLSAIIYGVFGLLKSQRVDPVVVTRAYFINLITVSSTLLLSSLGNTPLHHEHGLLAGGLLGLTFGSISRLKNAHSLSKRP